MAVINDEAYIIADRTIVLPLNMDTFGVAGDSNSKVVEFRTDRFCDGIDLSQKLVYVCYKNAINGTGESQCTDIKFTETTLRFNWIVPPEVAVTTGNIEFYVEFRTVDNQGNKFYVMKTKTITKYIEDSFYVYNNATEPDYSTIDSWLLGNPERIDRDDLIDADLPFRVKDRDILFNPQKTIAVKNDNLSQALTFRLKRIVDGIDRSNMTFAFAFSNADNETGIAPACNIIHTEDEIFISWALESTVTKTSGEIQFSILAIDTLSDGKRYIWNTKTSSFTVESTLDIEDTLEVPSEKWYDSLLLEVDNAVRQASNYANKAKESYNGVSLVQTVANQVLEDCKEAELNAQKYAAEATEAFSSLKDVSITRTDKAENGVFKTVTYKRKNGTLYARTLLLMSDEGNRYTGLLVQLFADDGSTVITEETHPITYDDDGHITGYFSILNYLSYHIDVFSKSDDGVKLGTVISHVGKSTPYGYLKCDGAAYDIADYPLLANYISSEFESVSYFGGNGNTTFAVPNLNGLATGMAYYIKY